VPEVPGQTLRADVLEHADRGDRVVRAVVDVPLVLEPDGDAIGHAGFGHTFLRELGLPRRERHAHHARAVVGGRVDGQRPPPAPHVQHPLAGLEPQLAADQLVLVRLGVLERRVG